MRDKFKSIISNNPKIMKILFELLSTSDAKIGEDLWDIVTFIPINNNIKNQIETLSVDGSEVFF